MFRESSLWATFQTSVSANVKYVFVQVKSVKEVLEGPDVFIALQYNEDLIKPPGMLEPIGRMIHKGNTIDPAMADKSGVVRKGKSREFSRTITT